MDKNEILEKSRQDNKGNDEMHMQIEQKAMAVAFRVGFILTAVLYALDILVLDTGMIGKTAFVIYLAMGSTLSLTRGILGKEKSKRILGGIGVVLAALLTIMLIF